MDYVPSKEEDIKPARKYTLVVSLRALPSAYWPHRHRVVRAMFTLNERSPSFCFRQFERELKHKKKATEW
jgi:hypothetical protein